MRGRGFTLIEVVVAAALTSILITVIAAMNLLSMSTNGAAGLKDESFNIARGIIEMYKAQGISSHHYGDGAVYKYLNSIDEVESLEEVFQSCDGSYAGQELISPLRDEKYIVVLEAIRLQNTSYSEPMKPQLDMLRVVVMRNGENRSSVSLTQIR